MSQIKLPHPQTPLQQSWRGEQVVYNHGVLCHYTRLVYSSSHSTG